MPLYEYICLECKTPFEAFRKMDDPPPPCPKCGKESEKTVSQSTFRLKGGGWAEDGYSNGSE